MHFLSPIKFKNNPLQEAVWEIRFPPAQPELTEEVSKIIAQEFPAQYSPIQFRPEAENSPDSPETEPAFQPAAQNKPACPKKGPELLLGQKYLSLIFQKPPAWEHLIPEITSLAQAVEKADIISYLVSFSIKHSYCLEIDHQKISEYLNLNIKLDIFDLTSQPFSLRSEIEVKGVKCRIHLLSPGGTIVFDPRNLSQNVLLDIECLKNLPRHNSWNAMYDNLEGVNLINDDLFVKILRHKTFGLLEPLN
ncbi:MAG: TIGR04255 family protein [Deltaproteobacteria bacterium]|jgi:uncharacterized protein (TIGR04255 family)|nr:TIGR04255 family protein [Deltaproteobacteria bacterium]